MGFCCLRNHPILILNRVLTDGTLSSLSWWNSGHYLLEGCKYSIVYNIPFMNRSYHVARQLEWFIHMADTLCTVMTEVVHQSSLLKITYFRLWSSLWYLVANALGSTSFNILATIFHVNAFICFIWDFIVWDFMRNSI